jgi:hypothetical protein
VSVWPQVGQIISLSAPTDNAVLALAQKCSRGRPVAAQTPSIAGPILIKFRWAFFPELP